MKRWMLYFFSIFLVVAICPIVASKVSIANDIPIITVFDGENTVEMNVEEYTFRALLCEGFGVTEEEARKALAVSIRSEAYYLSVYGCKHSYFDVCTDGKCCLLVGREENFDEDYIAKTKSAVDQTFGVGMTFNRRPAMALFTYCSGSGTSDCEDFPYLVGVKEEKRCELHRTERTFPESVFETLKDACLVYDGFGKCSFGVFGGEYFSRDELLDELFLPSAEFELSVSQNAVNAVSYGFGNGFGLCICGSERMAKEGKGFEEILEFYYPNLMIDKFLF